MTSAELPLSLALPPSSPRLPLELLAQIVEEAVGDRDHVDYTTLRHLCLTSRSILPFAHSALYREISVGFRAKETTAQASSQEGHSSRNAANEKEEAERRVVVSDGQALEGTLSASPHLALLPKGIALQLRSPEAATYVPPQVLRRLLQACPGITQFRLLLAYVEEAEVIIAELLRTRPGLTELDIQVTENLPLLLARLPSLQYLRLRSGAEELHLDLPAFPFKLVSFRVDAGEGPTPLALIKELLRCSNSSLRRLDAAASIAAEASSRIAELNRLSHLRLYFGWTRDVISTHVAEVLLKCANLQSLELIGATLPSSEFARLPPQLSALYFERMVEKVDICSLLSDDSRGTLRHVAVGKSEEEECEELGEEHGWSVERYGKKVVFMR